MMTVLASIAMIVAVSSGPELLINENYLQKATGLIGAARAKVTVCAYLMTEGGEVSEIEKCLVAAAKRGVAVQVILEQSDEEGDGITKTNKEAAARLKTAGIPVFFDGPDRRTHVKAMVVDSRYVLIGSHNLTSSALRSNNEVSVLIDDPGMAVRLEAFIDSLKEEAGRSPR